MYHEKFIIGRASWEFRQAGTQEWFTCKCAWRRGIQILLALDMIPDPLCGRLMKRLSNGWLKTDWEYQYRFFQLIWKLLNQPQIWLVCDGLDYTGSSQP